jgi:hypothetical protein
MKPLTLNRKPSIDGLGVKLWRFRVPGFELAVFYRPSSYACTPYLIQLCRDTGEFVESCVAIFTSQAEDKAQWLLMRAERGEFDS